VQTANEVGAEQAAAITVDYLPAAVPFKKDYDDETVVSTVRSDSMGYFQVSDHKDRDQHEFFLEFEGKRLTDTSRTLEQIFGRDRRHAKFNLVEQITPGNR
jgi:hypothetical protein